MYNCAVGWDIEGLKLKVMGVESESVGGKGNL